MLGNPRRRRIAVLGALVTLVVSACGGSDSPSPAAPQEPLVVTSDDGLLSVEIPAGAVPDEEVTVRKLAPEELPEELQGFELRGAVHELGPDGLAFSEPVTVTRRIDPEALGFDPAKEVPLVTLFSRTSDGTWSVLDDQSVTVEDGWGVVTGATTHFSTVAAFGGGIQVSMRPDEVTVEVGQSWTSRVHLIAEEGVSSGNLDLLYRGRGAAGLLVDTSETTFGDVDPDPGKKFTCDLAGEWNFYMEVTLTEIPGLERILPVLGLPPADRLQQQVVVPGRASCRGAAGTTEPPEEPEEPKIERGCAYWEHQGSDTEYDWIFELVGAVEGGKATIRGEEVNGGEPITAPVQQADRGLYVFFSGRINTFDPHPIKGLNYKDEEGNTYDLTKPARRLIGDGQVGSEPEGTIGDCGWLKRLIP